MLLMPTTNHPCLIQKKPLLVIVAILKILSGHLHNHQTHSFTALNLNPDLKSKAIIKTHRFQTAKNHMAHVILPPNPGGYCTTTSYSDVCIADNMNMHLTNFLPNAVSFPTQTSNKDKPPTLSNVPTL